MAKKKKEENEIERFFSINNNRKREKKKGEKKTMYLYVCKFCCGIGKQNGKGLKSVPQMVFFLLMLVFL